MSIGQKIKGLFAGSDAGSAGSNVDVSSQVLVIDGAGMAEGKKGADGKKTAGTMSPREQIDVLQSLSRINKREKFEIHVVFVGEPLRKVEHGECFDEVRVFFAEDQGASASMIISRVKSVSRGQAAVLVTSNPDLERQATSLGARTLRIQTFKKGFEEGGSSRGRGGDNRGSNRGRRSGGGDREGRGGNRRRGGGGNGGNGGNGGEEGGNSGGNSSRKRPPRQPRSEAVGGSDVSDLIDLVE